MQFLIELIITYLLVGMCVQLPGVAWGHFLRLRWFRLVADADGLSRFSLDYRGCALPLSSGESNTFRVR